MIHFLETTGSFNWSIVSCTSFDQAPCCSQIFFRPIWAASSSIAGTFAGFISALPQTGRWMTRINHIFGWILIGAGEYFLYTAGSLSI